MQRKERNKLKEGVRKKRNPSKTVLTKTDDLQFSFTETAHRINE